MLFYGVFEWNEEGSYPGHKAIKLYWCKSNATRLANKLGKNGRRIVVREVNA